MKETSNILLQSLKQMNAIANILRKNLNVHLYQQLIEHFANVLIVFIYFDAILDDKQTLFEFYRKFNEKLSALKDDYVCLENRKLIEKFFNDFQMNFSQRSSFMSVLDHCFKFLKIFYHDYIETEINYFIKNSLMKFEKSSIDLILNKRHHLQLNAVVVFSYYLCGEVDSKILKRLALLNSKVCFYLKKIDS